MQGGRGQDTIPSESINITTEFPSDSPSHSHHVLSSGLLFPHSPTYGPHSPDLSDSGFVSNPPSPTLSNHSGLLSPDSFDFNRYPMLTSTDAPTAASKETAAIETTHGSTSRLSGLLNSLDGVAAAEGRLLFATTNRIERLDPALSRPGRMDVWVNFTHATKWQAEGVFKCFFPFKPSSVASPATPKDASQGSLYLPVRREMLIRKRKSKPMIQGKEITISGGKLTNVGGDYHEHNTTYVIEEAPAYRRYLETFKDRFRNLETIVNKLLSSSPKEDNTKSDDSSRQTMHSPSPPVEIENMGDTSSSNNFTELQFNSLNDPPQSTSVFDDGYCIYQTPTPSRINDFTPNSRTFSAMAQDGGNLVSGNQHAYPFGYLPFLVPGIVHYSPCWLPSWGGWIASWISWISPPSWIWPPFL